MGVTKSSTVGAETVLHTTLGCGAELVVTQLPARRAQALEIRVLVGIVDEPDDRLGLAHLVEQTLDKGTAQRDGRAVSDAFDALGASVNSWCGRESSGFTVLCLPEFFDPALALWTECLRTPAFPEASCEVALSLAKQELLTLDDDAAGLAEKMIGQQAYGPLLGRHVGGEQATLAEIASADFPAFWQTHYRAGRMIISSAGPLAPAQVAEQIEAAFDGFGPTTVEPRRALSVEFTPGHRHLDKETEQQQIALALPGVPIGHADQPAQQVLLGVLSGGMSGRLFTEVREKQGLVYWVGAWAESPRGSGMLFLAASTTPQRCERTYETLVRELARVAEDVAAEEIDRALAGVRVRADIHGDITRARCSRAADDLVHYGRPVPWAEKLARLEAVSVEDVRSFGQRYLAPAALSVVTVGPRLLDLGLPKVTGLPTMSGASGGHA